MTQARVAKIDCVEVILRHGYWGFQEVFVDQTVFYNAKQRSVDVIVCKQQSWRTSGKCDPARSPEVSLHYLRRTRGARNHLDV